MSDTFADFTPSLNSPGIKLTAVTLDDSTDLNPIPRALYVGVGGNITLIAAGDTVAVLLQNVPSGALLSIRAKRVKNTGTTASGIVAVS